MEDTPLPDGAVPAGNIEYWASLGNLEKVTEFVDQDEDVNSAAPDGYTGLHGAAENGHDAIVAFLLDRGANPNLLASEKFKAADLARMAGHEEIAKSIESSESNR